MKALLVNTELNIIRDEDTEKTLLHLRDSLIRHAWEAEYYIATTNELYEEKVKQFKPDVTLCYDYVDNQNLTLRSVNEKYGIPDVFACQKLLDVFYDKQATKELVSTFGIKTPKSIVVEHGNTIREIPFAPPYFVKLLHGGDSRGIHSSNVFFDRESAMAFARSELLRNQDSLMVEEYIHDEEAYEFGIFMSCYKGHCYYASLKYHYDIPKDQRFRYLSKEIKDHVENYNVWLEEFDFDNKALINSLVKVFEKYQTHGIIKAEFIQCKRGTYLIEINGIPGLNLCFENTSKANGLSTDEYIHIIFSDALV